MSFIQSVLKSSFQLKAPKKPKSQSKLKWIEGPSREQEKEMKAEEYQALLRNQNYKLDVQMQHLQSKSNWQLKKTVSRKTT